jgi:monoamine oxidase
MQRTDVVVIGAGLAGLSCARDLARAGTDVLLVEARGRVGGRVEGEVLADGRTVQLGGEIVGEVHHAYLGLVAELGLALVDSYVAEPGEVGFDLVGGVQIGEGWRSGGRASSGWPAASSCRRTRSSAACRSGRCATSPSPASRSHA